MDNSICCFIVNIDDGGDCQGTAYCHLFCFSLLLSLLSNYKCQITNAYCHLFYFSLSLSNNYDDDVDDNYDDDDDGGGDDNDDNDHWW